MQNCDQIILSLRSSFHLHMHNFNAECNYSKNFDTVTCTVLSQFLTFQLTTVKLNILVALCAHLKSNKSQRN